MKRRTFLQHGVAASAFVGISYQTDFVEAADNDAHSVISLIDGRKWTLFGSTGRLHARDDKVYCELQDKPRHGMTMIIRSYAKAKEDIASGKISEQLRGNEGIDKFLAHDGEGRLVLTRELCDAAKWIVGIGGSTESYKIFKTDRDDELYTLRIYHAVGYAKNRIYLGLDPVETTYDFTNGLGQKQTRTIQQLILTDKEDASLAIWINDFSGK